VAGAGCAHFPTTPSTSDAPSPPLTDFVIIFRQGPRPLTEADKALRQQAMPAWLRARNAAGRKLEPRILGPEAARPGPQTRVEEGAWPVTALLFIQAADLADAAQVAASHPATRSGAEVEVRPWAPPPPLPAP